MSLDNLITWAEIEDLIDHNRDRMPVRLYLKLCKVLQDRRQKVSGGDVSKLVFADFQPWCYKCSHCKYEKKRTRVNLSVLTGEQMSDLSRFGEFEIDDPDTIVMMCPDLDLIDLGYKCTFWLSNFGPART